jgi:formiminoglutamate deiminase
MSSPGPVSRWWAELAWLGDPAVPPVAGVLIEAEGGRFTSVTPGAEPDGERLPGLTIPGLANVHSHAFHRALRGRTHAARGSFWTWREHMYEFAAGLDPDSYHTLARAVYGEMALAGITAVGEFHYLHHGPDGRPYGDANVMSAALVAAAAEAGIRITLLDTCYLAGGVGEPVAGVQLRFSDGDAAGWAARAGAFRPDGSHARVGAAIHSVRAVPAGQLRDVVGWAADRDAPLHVHLSEQRAENEASLAAYGHTPTGVLAAAGALGPRAVAVHATHLTSGDVGLLGSSGTGVCLCPTTERDLADGIGPARELASSGSPLSLGSDGHAVIDLFEEARAVELGERVRTEQRGHFWAGELLGAATAHGAIGWPDAGRIAPGAIADLVTVGLDSVRLAGTRPGDAAGAVVFAATAADVRTVVASGRTIVRDGHHTTVDVPAELAAALTSTPTEVR